MNQFKKGAMFGLDARIALAIFGALSVISGAALYSAIQDSKITATVAQFEELSKATDAYLLDTGVEIPVYTTTPVFLLPNRLIENLDTVNGWNGPYWSRGYADAYDNTDILGRVGFLNYLGAGIVQAAKTDWGSYTTNDAIDTCTATDCHLWAYIEHHHSDDLSLAKGIEEKVDNTDNAAQGKVRVRKFATGYNLYYYIRPKTQ